MQALNWDELDWAALDRLRATFLAGAKSGADYWQSPSDLANYDATFAQRIGWKWDAVLAELKQRAWSPPPGLRLLDWGCGSGIASRRVLAAFGAENFKCLRLYDQSPLAVQFAAEAAHAEFPALRIERGELGWLSDDDSTGVLVISHVLNELDERGGRALRSVIDRADAILWVEPGTYADSRSLIAMREALHEVFVVIGPCTHQAACGLRGAANERHWCHHFAASPPGIMADGNWVRFAQRAGIDLRSVPYSFLVLERRGMREPVLGLLSEARTRVIGEPRLYKGFARILGCRESGVSEIDLQKRDAPEIFKAIKSGRAPTFLTE